MERVQHQEKGTMIDLNYIADTIDKTWFTCLFGKITTGIALMFSSFFIDIYPFIWLTIFLVISDFITGIIAAKYPKDKAKKVNIESTKIMRSVFKFSMYGIAICVWHGIGKVFMNGQVELVYFCSAFIAFTELKSIDENFRTMIGVSIYEQLKDKIKLK